MFYFTCDRSFIPSLRTLADSDVSALSRPHGVVTLLSLYEVAEDLENSADSGI